jgi:hypothetical protein
MAKTKAVVLYIVAVSNIFGQLLEGFIDGDTYEFVIIIITSKIK